MHWPFGKTLKFKSTDAAQLHVGELARLARCGKSKYTTSRYFSAFTTLARAWPYF
jgi:hypothetical protein